MEYGERRTETGPTSQTQEEAAFILILDIPSIVLHYIALHCAALHCSGLFNTFSRHILNSQHRDITFSSLLYLLFIYPFPPLISSI